jgi:hypothetical protein
MKDPGTMSSSSWGNKKDDLELGHFHIDRSALLAVMESVSLSKLDHYGGVLGM